MKEFYNYEAVVVALRLAELGHDQEATGSILATSKLFSSEPAVLKFVRNLGKI